MGANSNRAKRMSRNEFQDAVVEAVRAEIGHKPWFRGVCTDCIHHYYPNDFEKAVAQARDETYYWDGAHS